MIRLRRRDRLWFFIISLLAAIAILAPELALGARIGIIGLYAIIAGMVLFDYDAVKVIRQQMPKTEKPQGSAQAREALNRAASGGGGDWVGLALEDIGLIASVRTEEGLTFQRTRSISNNFDGARPYIQVQVGASMAERRARLRYELIDPTGEARFVHEENAYLRLGENTLHPDQHMPLGDMSAAQMGQWDIKVYVDGRLMGILGFTAAPTDDERLGRLSNRRDRPASFEDLLRQGRGDRD
jgi:hypothetical protein